MWRMLMGFMTHAGYQVHARRRLTAPAFRRLGAERRVVAPSVPSERMRVLQWVRTWLSGQLLHLLAGAWHRQHLRARAARARRRVRCAPALSDSAPHATRAL